MWLVSVFLVLYTRLHTGQVNTCCTAEWMSARCVLSLYLSRSTLKQIGHCAPTHDAPLTPLAPRPTAPPEELPTFATTTSRPPPPPPLAPVVVRAPPPPPAMTTLDVALLQAGGGGRGGGGGDVKGGTKLEDTDDGGVEDNWLPATTSSI